MLDQASSSFDQTVCTIKFLRNLKYVFSQCASASHEGVRDIYSISVGMEVIYVSHTLYIEGMDHHFAC